MAKKVLIADEDQQVLMLAGDWLRKEGYTVVLVRDGRDALRKVLNERPDAILLDPNLPGLGTTDVYTMLKSNEMTRHIPLACLAGPRDTTAQRTLREGGALLLIPKPFSAAQLVSSVGLLVSARQRSSG